MGAPLPRREFVSPSTERLIELLPPFLQNAVDMQALLDACAAEMDRLDAATLALVRGEFADQALDPYLSEWERLLGLSVHPADKTVAQRQNSTKAFFQGLRSASSGLSWRQQMTTLLGTSWDYDEHGDYTIRIFIPFTAAIAAPAQPSESHNTSGSLGAGTYRYKVTARNFYGETTPSPERSVTVAANGKVTLDWPDVAGATGYSVFRASGAGDFHRLATGHIANSAYVDDGTTAVDPEGPPSVNTTDSFQASEARLLARKAAPAHLELEFQYMTAFILNVNHLGDTL